MKRRITYVLFAFVIIAGLLGGCSKKVETTEQVSRGEWIAMLSEAFALDTYHSDIPYYSDITNDSPLFSAVQAAAEWGILSIYDGDQLEADRPITREEAASTAAISAGFRPNENGEFDTDAAIDYALKYDIVSETGNKYLEIDECTAIIDATQNLYLTNPDDEKMEVDFADELVDLRAISTPITFLSENEIVLPASLDTPNSATVTFDKQNIPVCIGSTFWTPATEEFPVGAAYKVTSMREENGQVIFSVEAPNFGDIYDYVDIHTTVSLSDSSIVWADGVEVSPVSTNSLQGGGSRYHIQLLSSHSGGHRVKEPDTNSFSVHWKREFNTGVNRFYEDTLPIFFSSDPEARDLAASNFIYNSVPSLSDFNGSTETWIKELDKIDKYSDGYDITIDVDFQLTALVDMSYYKLDALGKDFEIWPESVSVTLNSNISADFKMEGSILEEQKLQLGGVHIPIGNTGLTIDGYLFLYIDATGAVEIKLEIENTQRAGWNLEESQQGYQPPVRRRTGQKGNTASAEVVGSIDLSTGFGLEVDLSACSTIKLIEVDLKIGGDLESKGTVTGECIEQTTNGVITRHYTETLELGSSFYIPMITLTVSGPEKVSDILGLEKSWEIVGKDETVKIDFLGLEWLIWEETVQVDSEGVPAFDFLPYAGTYEPYKLMEGQTASALRINDDGTIWGESGYSAGSVSFSNPLSGNDIKPISVVTHESGAIECTLFDEDFNTITEDEMARLGSRIRYIIYPPDVVQDEKGKNQEWLEETRDKTRILYLCENNGVEDIKYCSD